MLCKVELRAFCLKHSDLQDNRSILPSGDSIPIGSELSEANGLPVNSERKLKIGCGNGGVMSDSSPDNLNHNDMLGCGAVQQHNVGVVGGTNENGDASDSLSFALVLKKVFCVIFCVYMFRMKVSFFFNI